MPYTPWEARESYIHLREARESYIHLREARRE